MGCHLSGVLCLERRGDLWRRRWWEKGHLLTYQTLPVTWPPSRCRGPRRTGSRALTRSWTLAGGRSTAGMACGMGGDGPQSPRIPAVQRATRHLKMRMLRTVCNVHQGDREMWGIFGFFPQLVECHARGQVEANRGAKKGKDGRMMTECTGVQARCETEGKKSCRIIT
ncbi:hypothetical protein Naga_100438g2 [Nannochloropsis gaditana]|uniref:Uncharacterized protein n=1 Tax=Nannochloropsis gaditana TaxID=72520 RepID=W7TV10_9STRA|nr:hypothetical protein Naga_100438g2 [Nannochloropsis gaditana]